MWFEFEGAEKVASPALIFYKKRIEENIEAMISMAGSPGRLCPHVKTHKCPEIVKMQIHRGINAFKCATIAEAEMTAQCGATDILMAYQLVGPTLERFLALRTTFPEIRFSSLCDNESAARKMAEMGEEFTVYIDVDCGMHRTGISPENVPELIKTIDRLPGISVKGFHAYDGHLHMTSIDDRKSASDEVYSTVLKLLDLLPGAEVIIGGSPTFPLHAAHPNVLLSPGTTILWDGGYQQKEGLEQFRPAALILARVISTPGKNLYCLDAGHKAISAEHQQPPKILGLNDFTITRHSEEHLTIETGATLELGQVMYLIPHHICPTVALYDEAVVIENRKIDGSWPILARKRKISI